MRDSKPVLESSSLGPKRSNSTINQFFLSDLARSIRLVPFIFRDLAILVLQSAN